MGEHFFWITSRAAGISALLASSAAVALGLLMSTRLLKSQDLRVLHEALSLATMVSLAVHALALLGDGYLKPSLADVTLPFFIAYETLWTSLGIVGGWMFVILGLSYYVRGRIGPQRWRKLHRFTALAWVLGIVHSLGAGTDAGARGSCSRPRWSSCPRRALLVRRLTPARGDDMRFDCFGTPAASGAPAPADARRQLEPWHGQFSRFRPDSELTRLNADPRGTVPVSPTMARLLEAIARRGTRPAASSTARCARDRGRGLPRRPRRPLPLASRWRSRRRAARAAGRPTADFTLLRAGDRTSCAARPGSRSTPAGSPRACSPT